MAKELKNGLKLSGCTNCKSYDFELGKCSIGNDVTYTVGAHFLCDDFEQLHQSPVSSGSIIDNYFKKA